MDRMVTTQQADESKGKMSRMDRTEGSGGKSLALGQVHVAMNDTTVTALKVPVSAIISGIEEMNIPEMETRIASVAGSPKKFTVGLDGQSPGSGPYPKQPSTVVKVSAAQQMTAERGQSEREAVSVEEPTPLPFLDGPDSAGKKDMTPEILHTQEKRYEGPAEILEKARQERDSVSVTDSNHQ